MMRIFGLTLMLFSWSTLVHAQGDLDRILGFISEQGISESNEGSNLDEEDLAEWEDGEIKYDYDFSSLNESLSFVQAYEDFDKYKFQKLEQKDLKEIAKEFIQKKLIQTFDHHFSETKFTCEIIIEPGTDESKKCSSILKQFDAFNQEIDNQLNASPAPGGKVEDLFGITLDGVKVTENEIRDADGNYKLLIESEQTPNRNSVISKHHFVRENDEKELSNDIADAICNVSKRLELKIQKRVLNHSINVLKDSIIDLGGEVSLTQKQEAFCTLYEYWMAEDNFDQIIEFLYLHQPKGDLPCAE